MSITQAMDEREAMTRRGIQVRNCDYVTPTHVCVRYGGHSAGDHVLVKLSDH